LQAILYLPYVCGQTKVRGPFELRAYGTTPTIMAGLGSGETVIVDKRDDGEVTGNAREKREIHGKSGKSAVER
jgi:hypothetical protein